MSRSTLVTVPTPQQLDEQSPTHIDEWVEVGSERFQQVVGGTSGQGWFDYFVEVGFRQPNPFFFLDELKRVWGRYSENGKWFPFHDTIDGKNIGYRYAKTDKN